MTKIIKTTFSALFFSFTIVFQACKPEEPVLPPSTEETTVNLSFTSTVNSNPFYMDSAYNSEVSQAYKFYFTLLKFYVSDVYLIGDNDSVKLTDVQLVDFKSDAPNTVFNKLKGKPGTYNKIRFGLGLNPIQNAGNPADYEINSPLSASQGTYWGMSEMYRFTLIEGKMDTTNTGNSFNKSFAVHVGFNKNYKIIELPISTVNLANGVSKDINLNLDLYKLLFNAISPTNFKTNAVSHSDNALATLIQQNLSTSIEAN